MKKLVSSEEGIYIEKKSKFICHLFNVTSADEVTEIIKAEKKKYYDTTENEFIWPTLMHGCSNDKTSNYGIIIEKCRNDTLKKNCKSQSEIDEYLEHKYGILYFIDKP